MSQHEELTQVKEDVKNIAEVVQFLLERFSYDDDAEGYSRKLEALNKKMNEIIYRD